VVTLTLSARVRPLIWVSSSRIYLSGKEGEPVHRRVEIRTDMDKPLELTPGAFTLSGQLTYELKEIEKGRRFEILFSSLPGSPRTYRGFLKLRTNYPRKPELTIRIRGRFTGRNHGS